MRRAFGLLFVLVLLAAASLTWAADFTVIANSGVSADSLSASELSDIFLKKKSTFPDGTPASPIDQTPSAVREDFSMAIHGKTVSAVQSYWQRLLFSGRKLPPLEKATDADVVEYVKNKPGAIGYVSVSAAIDGVHVLQVR